MRLFKKRKLITAILFLFIFIVSGCSEDLPADTRSLSERVREPGIRREEGAAKIGTSILVERVIDGDTVVIEGGQRLRLIGVNSPELDEPGGKEAKEFTEQHLLAKNVQVREDINLRDKYDRLLLYVFLEDGTFFNELLILEGHAVAMPIPPNVAYAHVLAAAEEKKGDGQ